MKLKRKKFKKPKKDYDDGLRANAPDGKWHGQLFGLTPAEAYGERKTVNFKKILEKMIDAHHKRISYNQTHACLGCPFGCKQN